MRFHVVSLPHTNTTNAFPSCAFTQKVVRFCKMMTDLKHEVILYGAAENGADCTEFVPCLREHQRAAIVGAEHYTKAPWSSKFGDAFNATVIAEMESRLQPRDFICLIGGTTQKPIADAYPANHSVEFGIGYPATFASFRVFESYAWMHTVYGAEKGADRDGNWYDAVIPNQFDLHMEPIIGSGTYGLYVGRLEDRKGYKIAQEVCEKKGIPLVIAGPGKPAGGWGKYVGEVDAYDRVRWMVAAKCLFAPTQYIEPFGTVTIEAMACGVPVICTDWGAFTETIVEGRDGFRCRTFQEFCDAVDKVDGLNRKAIALNARKRFSMRVVGKMYERYFERLMTMWEKDGWYHLAD